MKLLGINHLAFITDDMTKTIHFWRDLLGLRLHAGIGHDGYRHYFFMLGDNRTQVAFFEYDGASPMVRKFPGERTKKPLGFDHVSFTVETKEVLFGFKERLLSAGFDVHGAVDHGLFWSIYFYDPNNIPLEITWEFMEVTKEPAIVDDHPLPSAENALPQGRQHGEPHRIPPESMTAKGGNAYALRDGLLKRNCVRFKDGIDGAFIDKSKL